MVKATKSKLSQSHPPADSEINENYKLYHRKIISSMKTAPKSRKSPPPSDPPNPPMPLMPPRLSRRKWKINNESGNERQVELMGVGKLKIKKRRLRPIHRNMTLARRAKIEDFRTKCDSDPSLFGIPGSAKFMEAFVVHMDEPSVINEDAISYWLEKNPHIRQLFSVHIPTGKMGMGVFSHDSNPGKKRKRKEKIVSAELPQHQSSNDEKTSVSKHPGKIDLSLVKVERSMETDIDSENRLEDSSNDQIGSIGPDTSLANLGPVSIVSSNNLDYNGQQIPNKPVNEDFEDMATESVKPGTAISHTDGDSSNETEVMDRKVASPRLDDDSSTEDDVMIDVVNIEPGELPDEAYTRDTGNMNIVEKGMRDQGHSSVPTSTLMASAMASGVSNINNQPIESKTYTGNAEMSVYSGTNPATAPLFASSSVLAPRPDFHGALLISQLRYHFYTNFRQYGYILPIVDYLEHAYRYPPPPQVVYQSYDSGATGTDSTISRLFPS